MHIHSLADLIECKAAKQDSIRLRAGPRQLLGYRLYFSQLSHRRPLFTLYTICVQVVQMCVL